jgi:hypothetical protein
VRASVESTTRHAHFELTFSPNLQLISFVRRFVSDFYESVTKDPEVSSRLELTTHELLENAVKFAADGVTTIEVTVTGKGEGEGVKVVTRNRATPENAGMLRSLVKKLAAAEDPFQQYQQLMRESAKRAEGSGLGLGRIHAEADMHITCSVDDNDAVEVVAMSRKPEAKS